MTFRERFFHATYRLVASNIDLAEAQWVRGYRIESIVTLFLYTWQAPFAAPVFATLPPKFSALLLDTVEISNLAGLSVRDYFTADGRQKLQALQQAAMDRAMRAMEEDPTLLKEVEAWIEHLKTSPLRPFRASSDVEPHSVH